MNYERSVDVLKEKSVGCGRFIGEGSMGGGLAWKTLAVGICSAVVTLDARNAFNLTNCNCLS